MHYITSTMAADVTYHLYSNISDSRNGVPKIKRSVLIRGKSGVADKVLITPMGVRTVVSDEDMELLNNDITFNTHRKNGYITVESSDRNTEVVVADGMKTRDDSAPITPEDFAEDDKAKPVGITGKKDSDKIIK
jgi:hypothetical protein